MCDWLSALASFDPQVHGQIPCRPARGAPVPAARDTFPAPAPPPTLAAIDSSTLLRELERRASLSLDDASRPRDRLALLAELSQNLPAGAKLPASSTTKPRAAEAEDIKKMRNDRREKKIYRSKSLSPPRRSMADAADDYAAVSAAARDGKYAHPAHPPPPRKRSHHEAGEAPPRGGKWTDAELRYAGLIVARFSDGTFPGLRGGESLRNLLADLLQCTSMRVTKQYRRTRLLRKTAFVRAGELGADGVAALESARAAFLADEPHYSPASRFGSAARDAQISGAAGDAADAAPPDDAGATPREDEDEAPGEDRAEAPGDAPGEDAAEAPGEDAAPAPAAGARRRGRWTKPEEHYAALVIDHFATGKLPGLSGGESLREVLSDLLRCTRMRVTKKLSQTKILRKSSFWPLGELTAEEQAELDAARDQFIAAEPHYRRARAPLAGAREPPAPEPAAKPPAPAASPTESPDPIAPAAAAPVHSGD